MFPEALRLSGSLFLCLALGGVGCCKQPDPQTEAPAAPRAETLEVGTEARLQAVSVVDDLVVWVSGVEGTVARSLDRGDSWQLLAVPGAEALEFRDVHAFDAESAVLLASGPGEDSRVFVTKDGGSTWRETFRNLDPQGFFNCFAFDETGRGYLVGDPISGDLPVLTSEFGEEWSPLLDRPEALEGEAGFAASGTCLFLDSQQDALLLGTGGGVSRVHAFVEGQWSVAAVPLAAPTETAGVTSLSRSASGALAVGGGDVAARELFQQNLLVEDESGWAEVDVPGLVGPIFGLAWGAGAPGREPLWVAGPGGLAVRDASGSWHGLSSESHWAVAVSPSGRFAWAVGPAGRASRVALRESR